MSDFSQFPAGTSGEASRQSRAPSAELSEPKAARVIGVPNELRETRQPVRLRGTIERVNQDGTIRVNTPRGDVDIRIEDHHVRPREGQRVEVEIQAGRTPQEATISIAERPEIHRHAPSVPSTQRTGSPVPRQTSTPVRVDIQREPTEVQQRGQSKTLRPAETIRLLPLAPDLITQVIARPTEILQAVIEQITTLSPAVALEILSAPPVVVSSTPAQILTTPPPIIASESASIPVALQTPTVQVLTTALPALSFEPVASAITLLEPSLQISLPRSVTSTVLPDIEISITSITVPLTDQPIVVQPHSAKQPAPIATASPTLTTQPLSVEILSVQVPTVQITGINTTPIIAAINTEIIIPQNPFIQIPFAQVSENAPNLHTKPLILQEGTKAGATTAQIVGFIEESHAVISFTPLTQPFSLSSINTPLFVVQDSASPLPLGTQITILPQTSNAGILTPQSVLGSITVPPPGSPLPVNLLSPSQSWPVMEQIYQALAQSTPQAAHAMSNMTPNATTPAQFGSAAMFFIAAIRSGDLTNWLGDKATNLLRASGKSSLLNRLSQEGGLLSRAGAEPTSQDWRGVTIPHVWQNDIHKLALFYKQDERNDDGAQGNNKPTRFLFDLSLDKMGDVQLDGLFQGLGTQNMRLDLIVRTQEKFHQNIQMDMRKVYANALKQAQVTGELSFQSDPKQWVHITASKDDLFSQDI